MKDNFQASWDELSAEQQPFIHYTKKRDKLIICDSKINIEISADYTADIKVDIVIFEYGGIGNKKFHFENRTKPDTHTYQSLSCCYTNHIEST